MSRVVALLATICVVGSIGVVVACSDVGVEAGPSCVETGCGVHGRCAFEGERPSCVCQAGYAGPTCAECAPDFQDENGNGFCSPSCAATVCGPHERCAVNAGRAICSCVVGYSRRDDGECVFTGGPVDPSFDNPQPNGWATTGAATIETGRADDSGTKQSGWVRFRGAGEVFQSFEMPAYADAEPLALEVDVTCVACANAFLGTLLRFGEREAMFKVYETTTLRACLGGAAFGRTLKLGIRAEEGLMPDPSQPMLIGRAQIVPSPTCPAPGTIQNGDFESGLWKARSGNVDYITEGGTGRARLTSSCSSSRSAAIGTTISVPEALPSPAIAFWTKGTAEMNTTLSVNEIFRLGTVRGTGKNERAVVCVPEVMRGVAMDLRVTADIDVRCAPGTINVVTLDDFSFVSEPSCPR